jgi:hypothetical protein
METIVITIHPSRDDNEPVRALEALEQGADVLRLLDAVGRSHHTGGVPPLWRLVRASTNSPLTLEVSVDESADLDDIDIYIRETRNELVESLQELAEKGALPTWLNEEVLPVARNIFSRSRNGLGALEIGNGNGKRFVLDQVVAESVAPTLDVAPNVVVEAGRGEEQVWGEVEGTIVSVGTWYGKPAFRVGSRQLVKAPWCILAPALVESLGAELTADAVWKHKRVAMRGQLIYRDGSIVRVLASTIRDLAPSSPVDIEALRDPNFTGGLDPVEYLRRFYEGELVG